jgi:hypothetical protein
MKNYILSAVCALASILFLVGLSATYARAQQAASNASVSVSANNTVTAIDRDSASIFHPPSVSDNALVECFFGKVDAADEELRAVIPLRLGAPVGSSFTFKTHTIGWTLDPVQDNPTCSLTTSRSTGFTTQVVFSR